MNRRARIKVSVNGPYLVSGGVPLSEQSIDIDANGDAHDWRPGREYAVAASYVLCRCGRSKARPFCDGTHARVGFDGTETAGRTPYLEVAERVVGPKLELTDVERLCASARFCDRGAGAWKLTLKSRHPEARQMAIEEAFNCPAGRLVVWDKQGKALEPDLKPSIVLVEDPQLGVSGPLWVRGGITIEATDGTIYEIRNRVTLCRCGKSRNKPFCDGRHIPHRGRD